VIALLLNPEIFVVGESGDDFFSPESVAGIDTREPVVMMGGKGK
jgi:hypothetical protein